MNIFNSSNSYSNEACAAASSSAAPRGKGGGFTRTTFIQDFRLYQVSSDGPSSSEKPSRKEGGFTRTTFIQDFSLFQDSPALPSPSETASRKIKEIRKSPALQNLNILQESPAQPSSSATPSKKKGKARKKTAIKSIKIFDASQEEPALKKKETAIPFSNAWKAHGKSAYMANFAVKYWQEKHSGTSLESHVERTQLFLNKQLARAEEWQKRDKERFKDENNRELFTVAEKLAVSASSSTLTLQPIESQSRGQEQNGKGGTYLLQDSHTSKRYIVKVGAEDVGCLHNRKGLAHPFSDHLLLRPVSPYRGPQKEALATQLANYMGIKNAVAHSIIVLAEHPNFYSFGEGDPEFLQASHGTKQLYQGEGKKRVICLQSFVEDSFELGDVLQNWGRNPKLRKPFNQNSFEKVFFLTQLIGETDGNLDNFRVTLKDNQWHFTKIDSSLSFPAHNSSLLNALTGLPNADQPISDRYRRTLLKLNANKVVDRFLSKYDLSKKELQAFRQRVDILQSIVRTNTHLTYRKLALLLSVYGMKYKQLGSESKDRLSSSHKHELSLQHTLELKSEEELREAERQLTACYPQKSPYHPSLGGLLPLCPPFKKGTPSNMQIRLVKMRLRQKLSMPRAEKEARMQLYMRTGDAQLALTKSILDIKENLKTE